MSHALYAPSAAYRNLSCAGSIALIKKLMATKKIVVKESEYAKEGTLAHQYIEEALTAAHTEKTYNYERIECEEMRMHVQNYVHFIGRLNAQFRKVHKGVKHYIEKKVYYDSDFFGTADYMLSGFHKETGEAALLICDFKYGKGVVVDAEENEQLLCYGICAKKDLGINFDTFHFFVFQPRTPGKEFTRWSVAKETFNPAEIAIAANKSKCLKILSDVDDGKDIPKTALCAGEHCRFCPAKQSCEAYLADINSTKLKLLDDIPEVPDIQILTTEQKIEIFKRRKQLKSFIDDICKDVLMVATKEGIEGYKIVEGQKRRIWQKDVETIGKQLIELGVSNPFKKSLITIGDVEKQIGKGKIDSLVSYTQPGYQLVPVDDKRPAIEQFNIEEIEEIEI